ncbi:guanylate kinase [Candidatus Palibaumannia cicadellinicola]|uniref:Guanylate kinase n=1 Tax=Baumannia cicadellinicola subsp. Homalodisca coagulata TaxID=374463 RepID=KGUA_BAUCH|nr:guanylate kinase [Candidatus Baumannia cicadellinicola]Q1LTY3.1 RecName: Full=Guanylate kinase; AltName: Full=GMP kinase [Baumannia cicadellinicola str. Hc (Homalodisca coagulata)]ABF14262.1 guanylate kinase [Baumannia cicadellinicola str. Hc (Homalodisca coagulata)]MBS0032637.1 guanylate kinase [Candidatus Baumannia cicadellinicola]MCJ7462435.1 guanylate kinase [Candidatus Baumannia cicadellinicola]MCJ7463033.1 guanylate kinase [Candidatus Baumannia cicadellinicola]
MLYIISAPSGTGKSSLLQALLRTKRLPLHEIRISISHTTRAMRPGEINGQHYYFISVEEFEKLIDQDAFLEYARVFNHYYGTLRQEVDSILINSVDILLDIDWQGAKQIYAIRKDVRSIFIIPPSKDELHRRLHKRGQDQEEVINQRISQAVAEMIHYTEYDYLIINDDFHTALSDLNTIICAEQLHMNNQKIRYKTLISRLLQ